MHVLHVPYISLNFHLLCLAKGQVNPSVGSCIYSRVALGSVT